MEASVGLRQKETSKICTPPQRTCYGGLLARREARLGWSGHVQRWDIQRKCLEQTFGANVGISTPDLSSVVVLAMTEGVITNHQENQNNKRCIVYLSIGDER